MTPIVNERFDPPIGFQTSGGPVWSSEIHQLASGAEVRNRLWARPLRKWQISGVPLSPLDAETLLRFFNARAGAAQGFRFRDPFGFSTATEGSVVSVSDETIGTGNGSDITFQLSIDDGGSVRRTITRPVSDSVKLAVDGMETTVFSLDESTGVVTFETPPAEGAVVTAGFEFDLPVRFEADQLDLTQTTQGACQLIQLKLIELREAVS